MGLVFAPPPFKGRPKHHPARTKLPSFASKASEFQAGSTGVG